MFSSLKYLRTGWVMTTKGDGFVLNVYHKSDISLTYSGCEKCPSEEEIRPIRLFAIIICLVAGVVVWFFFSWVPFLPQVQGILLSCICFNRSSGHLENVVQENLDRLSIVQPVLEVFSSLVSYAYRIKAPQYFKVSFLMSSKIQDTFP